jgi:hypothetical protein
MEKEKRNHHYFESITEIVVAIEKSIDQDIRRRTLELK